MSYGPARRVPAKRRSAMSVAGLVTLVGLAVIAVVALIIGLNLAIAYFAVYKVGVSLGLQRGQAFALAVFYYVVSGLSSSIYFGGRNNK